MDHGGRVTLTVTDAGRMAPLDAVEMVIPSRDGSNGVDLSLPMGTRVVDDKTRATVQLKRELGERAELRLKTWTLDGTRDPFSWYFYTIPVANHLKDARPE